ncbi:MAG TPA: glycosyltransferase family 39 protein [Candidatus Dormibacteraeota bacterium]|nr:glycosyltransferase family 39 protein [Candidatus Dormibacteraeota bacterium]
MTVVPVETQKPAVSPAPAPLANRLLIWLLAACMALGLYLRFRGLSLPPYDNHSFRQCQTLSTIESFYRNGIDLLRPRALYMGYPGTFVLELPLFQALAASLYHLFGPHIEVVRLLNICFGALSTWLLYLLGARYFTAKTGLLAAAIYWLAPLNVVYQRSMLLDPMAIACALVCFYSLARLLEFPGSAGVLAGNGFGPQTEPLAGGDAGAPRYVLFATLFFLSCILTAFIKPLYLWPAVLLFGWLFLKRGLRFDSRVLLIGAIFAVGVVCVLAWNHHTTIVNSESPITRGSDVAAHLGLGALFKPAFWKLMLVSRPKWWIGPLPVLFYTLGLFACVSGMVHVLRQTSIAGFSQRVVAASNFFLVVALIPPTYLLLFANINFPHEYYQLVITPFLALVAAEGLMWLAAKFPKWPATNFGSIPAAATALILLTSFAVCVLWLKLPRLNPDVLKFKKVCADKFEPWSPGMLFASPEVTGQAEHTYMPAYLYAARLWGYGWVVNASTDAKPVFEEMSPGFTRLDYLVFYGLTRPEWVPPDQFRPILQNDIDKLFVFKALTR